MSHIVLCGDSIFDNKSHVRADEPDIVQQLQARLDGDSQATLLAVDGCITAELPSQFSQLPDDATHLFVSSRRVTAQRWARGIGSTATGPVTRAARSRRRSPG